MERLPDESAQQPGPRLGVGMGTARWVVKRIGRLGPRRNERWTMEGMLRVGDGGNMRGEQREHRVIYREKMWGVGCGRSTETELWWPHASCPHRRTCLCSACSGLKTRHVSRAGFLGEQVSGGGMEFCWGRRDKESQGRVSGDGFRGRNDGGRGSASGAEVCSSDPVLCGGHGGRGLEDWG